MHMHPYLNIAINAAQKAGDLIARASLRQGRPDVRVKARNDFVSALDEQAERLIVSLIKKAYPQHGILAEEGGAMNPEQDHQWVIDPLDGTTNFIRGFPQFSVSIAYCFRGQIQHGVVYDPIRDELFTASRGSGAYLNRRRIRVSAMRGLSGALLGTGFPFRQENAIDPYLSGFRALFEQVADVRRAGSAALDLAYVAAGRLDGFWEIGLERWDMAAGVLLIEEAGGQVLPFRKGDDVLQSGNIIAGNIDTCPAIQQQLAVAMPAGWVTA